jgi:hypothetical protein
VILDEKKYPAIHDVCDMYDVHIMTETLPNQAITYWLGVEEDLDGGTYAHDLTMTFFSLDELEAFCYRNMDEFARCMDRTEELNLSKMK